MNQGSVPAGGALPGTGEGSMQETIDAMRRVLAKRFGIADADLSEDKALDTLGLDSLAFIEYAFEVEGELHINLPDLPRDLVTIGDLARFIHSEVVRKSAETVAK
jgi:acyl carrier protein